MGDARNSPDSLQEKKEKINVQSNERPSNQRRVSCFIIIILAKNFCTIEKIIVNG